MIETLLNLDCWLFHFINVTLVNGLFDVVMPTLTDLNKTWIGRVAAGLIWLALLWKGGRKGRIAAIFLIPLIFMSDQLSSSVIKKLIARPRPCHIVDGHVVVQNIRLLVDCGGGFSFPSSHAANNFAAAAYFSYFYRTLTWIFVLFAGAVAFSRVYVGVHYPSDVLGGALIGVVCAAIVLGVVLMLGSRFSILRLPPWSRSPVPTGVKPEQQSRD
jgi:undecaprenyl-diphosphatase